MSKRHLMISVGPLSVRAERRTVLATSLGVLALVLLGLFALTLGDYALTIPEVFRALLDTHENPIAHFFVTEQRLPRVVAAMLVGAALAVSGAIMQSLSHNPLGSPDIIGFMVGAATGALVQIIVFDAGPAGAAGGAILGGIATALVIYLLAYRGGMSGQRLVLVGIGIAVICQAINTLLVARASLGAAQTAAQWLAGSFNAMTWTKVAMLGGVMIVLVPAAIMTSRALSMLTMGDDLATGLGVRVERQRFGLIALSVGLVAVATATAGPIAFIALAAPQIARRLTHTAGAGFVASAVIGAILVLASDIVAQRIFAPTQLAVGVVSGSLGGIYLIWLLTYEWRRS